MNIRELNAYDFYMHFNKVLTEASNFLFQRYVGNENTGDEVKLIFDMGCCYFEAKRRYYMTDGDDSVDDQNYDALEKVMYKFNETFPEITLLKDILDIVGYSEETEKKFIEDYRNEYDWDEDEEDGSEEDDEESEEDDED